jgi:hypothetical protein
MAHEHISYAAMVNREVGTMEHIMHRGSLALRGDRIAPVANGVGAKLKGLVRRLTDALAQPRQRELEREIARVLARSGGRITDSMEREMMENALASDWRRPG